MLNDETKRKLRELNIGEIIDAIEFQNQDPVTVTLPFDLLNSYTEKLSLIHIYNSVEIQNIQAHSVSLDASDNRDCQHDYETDNCISLVDLESALKSKLPIERKILYLLMLGYSDKEIAAKLGYTRQYVNRLKKRIWNMDSPR